MVQTRRDFLKTAGRAAAGVGGLTLASGCVTVGPKKSERPRGKPNIIFILATIWGMAIWVVTASKRSRRPISIAWRPRG